MDINKALLEKFNHKDLEWRVQTAMVSNGKPIVIIVPYLKSKAIKDRLDLIFGWDNWETKFIPIEKGFICEITIDYNGKKITKSDGAQYTNIEAIKGGMSDSFKRAAKMLGIGRYLDGCKACFAVCSLQKENHTEKTKTKDGKVIYWSRPAPTNKPDPTPTPTPTTTTNYKVTEKQLKRLFAIAQKNNWTEENINTFIKEKWNLVSKKDLDKLKYDELIKEIEENGRK